MDQEAHNMELQLLPTPPQSLASSSSSSSSLRNQSSATIPLEEAPLLDLQLSISLQTQRSCAQAGSIFDYSSDAMELDNGCVDALKWQAGEQIRLAAMEKAYAERVRELTRREMELAQSEFARARHVWERAREEVERAERMKERATRQIDSTCMEVTCQSCRQRFLT